MVQITFKNSASYDIDLHYRNNANARDDCCESHHTLSTIEFYRTLFVFSLKGPKLEIFGARVFTQIRPVWVSDLGTRPKNPKLGWFRPENLQFVHFSAVGYNAKDFLTLC
jgi:hypothetical protein